MMATRRRLTAGAAVVLVVLLVAGAAVLVRNAFFGPKTITAFFPTTTAIYPGDEVRVAGVKVGTIDAIEPTGTETKMTLSVDRGVPVPAEAKAVIVAPNLVSARYVQLTPAYREDDGGGPTMDDGAVIPSDRTAVPVEWDEVKEQLTRLATELGPTSDVSETSVSRFIDTAANAMDGNGAKLRETLHQLSGVGRILAEGSGNITDIIKNLQTFVTALRDSNQQIVMFQNRLATLTSVVNDSRSTLDSALTELSVAVGEVQRFVKGSRHQTAEQVERLGNVTQNLVDHRMDVEQLLHIMPTAMANAENMYHSETGSPLGSIVLNNFSNPVWMICGMIGAVENTTAPETAKLCKDYLGPALGLLNVNNVPLPINPYLMPSAGPEDVIYTDPRLKPGGPGIPDKPEPPPAVSAYTGLGGDVPPPPGYGQPPAVAPGAAAPPESGPAPLSPPLYPGAPSVPPVQAPSGPTPPQAPPAPQTPAGPANAGDMLLPAEVAPPPPGNSLNGQPIPAGPPAGPSAAEGAPPS